MKITELAAYYKAEFKKATEVWHKHGLEDFEWSAMSPAYEDQIVPIKTGMHLHYANYQVWHYEDYCRSGIPEQIVRCKPLIDKYNQLRNDLIEKIDEYMFSEQSATGQYNTETCGSVIDRISILALKVYHWNELVVGGKKKFGPKLIVANDQYDFLVDELDSFIRGMQAGQRRMRLFRQLKMYNNAETNPLHQAAATIEIPPS